MEEEQNSNYAVPAIAKIVMQPNDFHTSTPFESVQTNSQIHVCSRRASPSQQEVCGAQSPLN
jgi:hypothetical protein